jgi:cytoskeletal protein RodZ
VAEDDSRGSVVRGPPAPRIRPYWWAVLAVSVSLLALVASTSGHPNPTGARAAAPDEPANTHQSGSTAPPPTTATTEPAAGPSTVTPPTLPPSSPATSSTEGARVVARQTSIPTTTTTTAAAATTTTTTTTTAAAAGGSSLAAAVQPVAPITMSGALQQPDLASASYPFTGVGSMEVSASSTSTAPLLLTVTCPAGTLDEAGSSFVSVVIPDADGPCELVLKETEVQYVAVPYTVTIGPEGG